MTAGNHPNRPVATAIDLRGDWQPMPAAPRNGTKIRALFRDGLGQYESPFPVAWVDGCWVNAETGISYGRPIKVELAGWKPLLL